MSLLTTSLFGVVFKIKNSYCKTLSFDIQLFICHVSLVYHNLFHGNNLYLEKYYKDLQVNVFGNKEVTGDKAEGSFKGNEVLAQLQGAEE